MNLLKIITTEKDIDTKMWLKASGKLIFDPDHKTNKHRDQGSWKKTAMIFIDGDISEYYAWFIRKRFNLELSKPLRRSHVTVINDKFKYDVMFQEAKNNYNGKIIEFEYNTDVRSDSKHWWLPVRCEMIGDIREAAGLNRKPFYDLHLTIGRPHERHEEHSKYIHDVIKFYNGINV